MSFICPPVAQNWQKAWGWGDYKAPRSTEEQKYVYLNNMANVASYFISPLIGIIRIIVNTYFLIKDKAVDGTRWTNMEKGYLKAQIVRGAIEVLGGGYLMWIPDLIVTLHRREESQYVVL